MTRQAAAGVRTVLVANPSADVYGSDLQMLESVSALVEHGWHVVIAVPQRGGLTERLTAAGAHVELVQFPVLRRASASPLGILALAVTAARATVSLWRYLRRVRPTLLYVNTVTLPWWLLAARLARVPSLCHVHEAEVKDSSAVRRALTTPLLLATAVVPNSRTTLDVISESVPRLRRKSTVVYNGVAEPPGDPTPARADTVPFNLLVVGRISPRKAPDVVIEATALLRAEGLDVRLEICGSPFAGYEWFEADIRARAERPDLAGFVTFSGYVRPTWPALARSQVMVAPSLGESFGNAVVEAQFAERPVVATAVQGHLETVSDGETGLLVPPRDPVAVAAAVRRLISDRGLAGRLAANGRTSSLGRFTVGRFRTEMVAVVENLAAGGRS